MRQSPFSPLFITHAHGLLALQLCTTIRSPTHHLVLWATISVLESSFLKGIFLEAYPKEWINSGVQMSGINAQKYLPKRTLDVIL